MNNPNAFRNLKALQAASKDFEADLVTGYRKTLKSLGPDVANSLFVSFLRRSYGSMKKRPPDPAIDKMVEEFVIKNDLLPFFGNVGGKV